MRGYKMLIAHAELMASSPERVFSFLAERASKFASEFWDGVDEELEQALLARNDPLIEIGLARFCFYGETLRQLFFQFDKALSAHTKALRLAVLSNPRFEFGISSKDENFRLWLAKADEDEIAALFENQTGQSDLLEEFLSCGKSWQSMTEESRVIAVSACARFPWHEQPTFNSPADNSGYRRYKVEGAAWKLAMTVPTTRIWAEVLSSLYEKLGQTSSQLEDPIGVGKRWLPTPDSQEVKREADANGLGYLGDYQKVRQWLAVSDLGTERKNKSQKLLSFLASDDLAIRAAAYRSGALTPAQIAAAYEHDKNLAVHETLENETLWSSEDTRGMLRKIVNRWANDDAVLGWTYSSQFRRIEEQMRVKSPTWFYGEEDEESRPVEQRDIRDLLRRVHDAVTAIISKIPDAVTSERRLSEAETLLEANGHAAEDANELVPNNTWPPAVANVLKKLGVGSTIPWTPALQAAATRLAQADADLDLAVAQAAVITEPRAPRRDKEWSLSRAAMWGLAVGVANQFALHYPDTMTLLRGLPSPDYVASAVGTFSAGPVLFVLVAAAHNGIVKMFRKPI